MKFGFCVMADISDIGFYPHIEALGYSSAWVADSQMLFSDCYAVLALAARATTKLRLGPGTAICGTRIPPVHVAAMASLNRIAPGRLFLGIGTGNTALRTMGQKPMRMAAFSDYLRVLAALLRGETVDYAFEGRDPKPIRMLLRDESYMTLTPKIPLYVSGFGPRAMALAGEHGDGLIFAIPPRGVPVAQALGHARRGAGGAGGCRRGTVRGGGGQPSDLDRSVCGAGLEQAAGVPPGMKRSRRTRRSSPTRTRTP